MVKMHIKFHQVSCGDAASIIYIGTDKQLHHVFIDSGYERTYRNSIAEDVKQICKSGRSIDLWIVSHIHDDHIGGIISYVKAIRKGEAQDIISKWWYNSPFEKYNIQPLVDCTPRLSEPMSFAQGEILTTYLSSTGQLFLDDVVQSDTPFEISGLYITILSPANEALQKLRDKYKSKGLQSFPPKDRFAESEPMSATQNDYHKIIDDFDLNDFKEDVSIENNSSIAMIIQKDGKKLLWLSDALPSTITASLKGLGYSKDNPLNVDLVKVSHHGSRGNNSDELFSIIQCNKYVFCADGQNKHQLPTKECMIRILRNPNRNKNSTYEFIFTHDNITLRKIFEVDGKDVFSRFRFEMVFPSGKFLKIQL